MKCKPLVWLVGGWIAGSAGLGWSQEPPAEPPPPVVGQVVVQSSDGGPVMAFSLPAGGKDAMFMSGGVFSSGMFGGGLLPFGAGMPMPMLGGSLNWLQDPNVTSALEIVEEQRQKILTLRDEAQKRRRDFIRTLVDVAPDKRSEFLAEFGDLLNQNVDQQLAQILLPHQMKRLREIRLQAQMRAGGSQALASKELAEQLGITDEQKEQLRVKQKELREELTKKLEQMRQDAEGELLSVLTPSQRNKLKDMLGERYEFKPPTFNAPPGGTATAPAVSSKRDPGK